MVPAGYLEQTPEHHLKRPRPKRRLRLLPRPCLGNLNPAVPPHDPRPTTVQHGRVPSACR